MGKKNSEIMIEGDMFSETMREAQRAYRSTEWDKFKEIFADNKTELLENFDLLGNTAINMAARSDNPELLKELLGKLSEEERWRAVRKKNRQGNTLLHIIAEACKMLEMADIVLDFEKTAPLPPELVEEEKAEMAELSSKEKKEQEEEKRRPLLEWKNLKGETPVFKAAKFGNLKMLTHLVKRAEDQPQTNLEIHQEGLRETILHASLNAQSFDVALWIIMKMDKNNDLAGKQNKNDLTCLQLLARMPSSFHSHYDPQEFFAKLVYRLLPDEGYDIEGYNSFDQLLWRDLETGEQHDARPPTPGHLSRANYAVWKYLAKASNGIIEIIHLYLKEHPESINHFSEGGQNILHIAVKHRQREIFKWLQDQPELPSLASRVAQSNRTALHQVARMDYYRGSPLPGAAFQLQEELDWYKRVEKIVPPHLHMHCDKDVLTAGDLLDIEHDEMLADAQQWIKDTSQSCSTVAVLVATVVFAAAYTIPGGTEGGSALLSRSPVFIFFTIMDIVALAFSLASVVMFLSILNAPFELWDFHRSLPRKLSIGFAFLFVSLTTTMLAFSATILITIRLQWKNWTSTLVYSAALFPVTIFALIEFPLYKKIPIMFSKLFPNLRKKKISIGRSSRRV
ncbi:ankyrin repeat-containing protein NPR4-like [Neltuma alba]|uniref:ankyrin repeat-containing protein NPR4-like n=1 Tax=Neltuma alba TaxID=207710 RepID=UPI0010A52DD6|nr:ankyrin repeat-containing protein NPR4-like [Prosopis alba]